MPHRSFTPFLLALLRAAMALAAIWNGLDARHGAAADPPPDKSGYTLLDPTPPALLRSFNSDRPTKANVPYTIDAGRYQIEADLGVFTRDSFTKSRDRQTTWTGLSPIFKVGLTNDVQADVIVSGLYNRTELTNRASGATQTLEGFGDVTLRAKINLWGNDRGSPAFALMPYVKLPIGGGGGNDQVEGGVFVPFAISLPLDVTLIMMGQLDAQKNVSDGGTHAHFSQLINLNRPIVETLTGYVELYADESARRGAGTFYTFDVGLAWLIAPDLQIDLGTNIGLNKAAPDVQAYLGIARRF